MNKNLTDVTVLLDRSGSMASSTAATIRGFNEFVNAQKAAPGKCALSLVQFDDKYEPNYSAVDAQHVAPLSEVTYQPRGGTALLDALGRTIDETGKRLAAMPERARPARVVFCVITDGEENSSRAYTREAVRAKVTHQQDAYKWQFVFMGADIDSYADASAIGIRAASVMNYAKTAEGTEAVFKAMASNVVRYRGAGGQSVGAVFTNDEKTSAGGAAE